MKLRRFRRGNPRLLWRLRFFRYLREYLKNTRKEKNRHQLNAESLDDTRNMKIHERG